VNVSLPFKEVDFGYEGLGTKLALQHQQANNVEWGTVEYKGDDNFDAGGDIYSVKAPFEHLKYERLINGATNALTSAQVGWFVDDNNDPYFGKPLLFYPVSSTPTQIRFLNNLIGSFTNITTYFIPSNSVTINSGVDDSNINFNLEVNEYSLDTTFEGTLFEDYYKTYIEEIFNAKLRLTKVKAYLPISFLLNYSLADKVQILDRIYKINSIESNLETGESNLELLNLVNPYVAPVADVLPTVVTSNANPIQQTSATLNGQVTSAGSPAYTTRGFYWAVGSVTPTASDNNVIVSGTDTNAYSTNITSLSASSTYSFVAYAITPSSTVVTGNVITFTTAATQSLATVITSGNSTPTSSSTILQGNVTNVGVPNYSSKGFYYMQGSGTPDSSNLTLPVSGTSSGSFSGALTGLPSSTSYSYRAFAINTQGTAYGSVLTFSTAATSPTTYAPSVTTNLASSVGTSSVTFEGNVTDVGNPNYTVKGFVYITGSGTPSLSNTISNVTVVGTSAGSYNAPISGLNSNQFYSYRAYATNTVDTSYGAIQTFTTQSAATCSGGTLSFQNPVISNINASLGTGQISYSTGQCGNAISPALEFLFTNNEGEWLSESQVTSIQLFESGTNVSSQYTLDKVLVGDVMNITVGGNFPSASNDGNHTYNIHVSATNVDVYQTDISIPTTVQNASLSVYKDPSYEASKADFEGNNSVLKPRGESGDTYRYLLTYTANSGYEFTAGSITTPTVSPGGTGVSVVKDSHTSSTYVIEVTGSIQASDKTASLSYSGSPVADPATTVSFRYRISPQTSWNNVTGAVVVPENVVLQIEVVSNGAYYVTLTNSTLTTNVTPSTNDAGGTQVHDVTIANNLQGGGDLSGQFRVFPRASSTLLSAVRIDFNN